MTPRAYALKAGGWADPVGVHTPTPPLSWRVGGAEGDLDGFVVRLADSLDELSSAPEEGVLDAFLEWPRKPLSDGEVVYWQVGTRTEGRIEWSDAARIEAPLWDLGAAAAITHPAWVDPRADVRMPELATSLLIDDTVTRVLLSFTGNGVVVPLIDGRTAIAGELEPGYAQPGGSTPAVTWDITDALPPGERRLSLTLGGGMAYLPDLPGRYTKYRRTDQSLWVRALIQIWRADGTRETVTTGADWDARSSGTTVAHWYGGEVDDGPGGDAWTPAVEVAAPPHHWRAAPSVRVVAELDGTPVRDRGGKQQWDFGVNTAGRPRITVTGDEAATITLIPGEIRGTDGRVDQSTTGSPIWDRAALSRARRSWSPRFVYHGARYLDVEGAPAGTTATWQVLRAGNESLLRFSSSSDFLNRLHGAVDRAVQSNMFTTFTDCPHREKLGWLEQQHLCFDTLTYGYDVRAHLTDAVRQMVAAQTPQGLIPNIAPEHVVFDYWPHKDDITAFRDDVNWGRAIVEVPLRLHEQYGEVAAARLAWPAAQRYLSYLQTREEAGLLRHGLGDWVEIDESTPVELVATWGYAKALDGAAALAGLLRHDDARRAYSAHADRVWRTWRQEFHAEGSGSWGSGSQASLALALDSRALLDDERASLTAALLAAVQRAGNSFTVGEIGLPALVRSLSTAGRDDVVMDVISRTDVPGYGRQLAHGATALPESWHGSEGTEGVISQNHFMLGAIDGWIIGRVGGLRRHPDDIGWRRVVVDPAAVPGVDRAAVRYESPFGAYEVSWERSARGSELTVTAPPGSRVEIARPWQWGQISTSRMMQRR